MNTKEPGSRPKKGKKVETGSQVTKEEGKVVEKGEKEEENEDREEELKKQLQAREKEATENFDRLLRTQAEFENYKKRMERERTDTIKFCNGNLIMDMLPIVDNLEMALQHGENSSPNNSQPLVEGVEMVLNQLMKSLEKFGVTSFSSVGEKFDPNRHEAMMQVESDEHEANFVISEFQKGYFLNDRLLRPAKVTVTAPRVKSGTENGNIVNEDKTTTSVTTQVDRLKVEDC
ncbi:MAG: nucleotide exchange factor GrpE [Desulfobacterales bacterium]|jgi:molecular chaperone GrpE|nr:nucleotide exchange factor GrpE [Desulfobacterales bacterium]